MTRWLLVAGMTTLASGCSWQTLDEIPVSEPRRTLTVPGRYDVIARCIDQPGGKSNTVLYRLVDDSGRRSAEVNGVVVGGVTGMVPVVTVSLQQAADRVVIQARQRGFTVPSDTWVNEVWPTVERCANQPA